MPLAGRASGTSKEEELLLNSAAGTADSHPARQLKHHARFPAFSCLLSLLRDPSSPHRACPVPRGATGFGSTPGHRSTPGLPHTRAASAHQRIPDHHHPAVASNGRRGKCAGRHVPGEGVGEAGRRGRQVDRRPGPGADRVPRAGRASGLEEHRRARERQVRRRGEEERREQERGEPPTTPPTHRLPTAPPSLAAAGAGSPGAGPSRDAILADLRAEVDKLWLLDQVRALTAFVKEGVQREGWLAEWM